jgi:hypothetical protein
LSTVRTWLPPRLPFDVWGTIWVRSSTNGLTVILPSSTVVASGSAAALIARPNG